jgi:hypothetical protein
MLTRLQTTKARMTDQPTPDQSASDAFASVRRRGNDFARRIEIGDALMLLYLAAFARQYFWGVGNEWLAWSLTACVSVPACYFYVATRGERAATPRAFWLLVVLPLVFFYLWRVPFPDVSFDVLNYRLLHGERALRGAFFAPGDFFPSPAPFNPSPDIATGIARHLLGYRLGTVVNLLALIWAGIVVEKLLRTHVRCEWRRSACVLFVLLSEYTLFEINEYMIDVLALPLILEALRLTLSLGDEARRARGDAVRVAFLLGAAVAFKATNLSAVLAIAPFYSYKLLFKNRPGARSLIKTLASAFAVFVLPVLPFSVFMYGKTGNPVFPLYNAVFKSPYWTPGNFHDPRWGPVALWETLGWPLLITFVPERMTELKVYSGRITLACIASLLCLLFARRADTKTRTLCLVFLIDALLWSATTGYIRYALHLELLGGVILVLLFVRVAGSASRLSRRTRLVLSSASLVVLLVQATLACYYTAHYEWAMRPTVFTRARAYFHELRFFGRDYSLPDFLPETERARVRDVGVWVSSGIKASAMEALLRPDAAIIGVRGEEFFATDESRRAFDETIARAAGKRMMSLCFAEDVEGARRAIEARGLRIVSETPFTVPYFSNSNRIPMRLLEVERAQP